MAQETAFENDGFAGLCTKFGFLRLVVTGNRHGNYEYIVGNDLSADLAAIVLHKRSRWSEETILRDAKQSLVWRLADLGLIKRWCAVLA